ncbi:aminopeptidase P family protein [Fusibacter paucivorans]|uniref:Xaa-Pro aminopeptidase n=1 Tax=Fusibacter paucivorans TaxID=76009 RepID=A0ABS5PKP7_9FIRM|nr:aminopeptidase P family protein [Fusibacter paucivorans]MBS7525740.1 aminopeptidase P family protein [Fusibacter paucivorans]
MQTVFEKNRLKTADWLQNGEAMVVFAGQSIKSTADEQHEFRVNKNFFYFTGIRREAFVLVCYKLKDELESLLFIEKPNYDVEKWFGRKLSKAKATEMSGIEQVKYVDDFLPWLNKLFYDGKIETLWLDLEKLSWEERDGRAHTFAKEVQDRYPFVTVKTFHPKVSEVRMIKCDEEVNWIKEAIHKTHIGLNAILKALMPGMLEGQLDNVFEYHIRTAGADGLAFPTIAASGGNGVILHYVENDCELKNGELVLLDLGAKYKGYNSDITRTYPVSGKFTKRQAQIYNIVLKAQLAVIDAMKPGVSFERLNEVCKSVLARELRNIDLIKEDSELGKYYYHGVSHHLGLDVHDIGNRESALTPGMVLTVEPGLYIAEEAIGIRIEDDVLITEDGNIVLSSEIPKAIDDIESLMS